MQLDFFKDDISSGFSVDKEVTLLYQDTTDDVPDGWMIDTSVYLFWKSIFLYINIYITEW